MIRDVKNAIMGILDDMDEERFMSDTLYEHRITIDYDEVANIYIKHINFKISSVFCILII